MRTLYHPISFGRRLRMTQRRMRERDRTPQWSHPARVARHERLARWWARRAQRRYPRHFLPEQQVRLNLDDRDAPLDGIYWLIFRVDGWADVPDEHRPFVQALMDNPAIDIGHRPVALYEGGSLGT